MASIAPQRVKRYHLSMTHPNMKRAWIEWEYGPAGAAPILVIETDIPMSPGPNGMDSSNLDDMIDEAIKAYSSPSFTIYRARIVPLGTHRT